MLDSYNGGWEKGVPIDVSVGKYFTGRGELVADVFANDMDRLVAGVGKKSK